MSASTGTGEPCHTRSQIRLSPASPKVRTSACERHAEHRQTPPRLRVRGRSSPKRSGPRAIAALTATGEITDEKRQEFILWSDVLGVSMLVDALAHTTPRRRDRIDRARARFTSRFAGSATFGASIAEQGAGTPHAGPAAACSTYRAGRSPVPSSTSGRTAITSLYAVQDDNAPDDHLRGKFRTRRRRPLLLLRGATCAVPGSR